LVDSRDWVRDRQELFPTLQLPESATEHMSAAQIRPHLLDRRDTASSLVEHQNYSYLLYLQAVRVNIKEGFASLKSELSNPAAVA
jgi:hypothetical protein